MPWHPDIPEEYRNQIVTGDARELAKRLPDESVDLIYTDPPYPREYNQVWRDLGQWAPRVLKPGGSLITLCGSRQVPFVIDCLSFGLDWYWMGWLSHSQKATLRGLWVVAGGKPQLWFSKGGNAKWDHSNGPYWDTKNVEARDKMYHVWGQSTGYVIRDLTTLISPNWVVLDPFIGGANLPAACIAINHKQWIGFEIDPATAELARKRVANTQPPLLVPEPQEIQGELL